MTLLDRTSTDTFREGSTPVLETERLCLRAPRLEDAKQIAALVNDRRIAENTIRIPHPYAIADAREWIGATNEPGGERSFVVTIAGEIIGACGFHGRDAGLLMRAPARSTSCPRSPKAWSIRARAISVA